MSVSQAPTEPWLPAWFQPPGRSELATGHHLRPLRAADADLPDLPAGLDLVAVLTAAGARTSCCYGLFDDEERAVLGVVTVGPGVAPHDVGARWSVADHLVGTATATAFEVALPQWLVGCWPFRSPQVDAVS